MQSLRELVRPVDPELAHELSQAIQSGSYIIDKYGLLRSTDNDCDSYHGDDAVTENGFTLLDDEE